MFIYYVVLFQTRWIMFTCSSTVVQGGSCDTSRVRTPDVHVLSCRATGTTSWRRWNQLQCTTSISTRHLPPRRLVSETDMPPRASQLTESKSSCWIVSPAAHDSQLASAFSRNIAIALQAGLRQYDPDWAPLWGGGNTDHRQSDWCWGAICWQEHNKSGCLSDMVHDACWTDYCVSGTFCAAHKA